MSLTTTEIYSHVAIRKLKEIHTATHPGARLERAVATSETAIEEHVAAEDEATELLASLAAEAAEEEGDGVSV